MKIVINTCVGSYKLSEAAHKLLNIPWDGHGYAAFCDDRANPLLVACVEKLGAAANGRRAKLKVVEIPDDVDWEIIEDENVGVEVIHERHRSWQ